MYETITRNQVIKECCNKKINTQKILFVVREVTFSSRYRIDHLREQLIRKGISSDCVSIKDVKKLADGCPSIKSINLGGTKAKENTKSISKAMNVTEEEIQMLHELLDRGVEVEIRMTSNEKKILAKTVI